ncbi:MAG: hypothetical protein RSD57_01935 [Comamonas sp.]
MLITDALRTLAPFSLVAGEPVFHMFSRLTAALPGLRRSRKGATGAANDGQKRTQVHCFASAITVLRTDTQLSLLGDDGMATYASDNPAERQTERPIDRIRRPRKPSMRRRAAASTAPAATDFVSVQRCRALAANDASIKRYWAKPAAAGRERGMRWAMSGSMADIFAELERLERLERQHAF